MTEEQQEDLYFKRFDWLKEHGREAKDILEDKNGQYINADGEDGYDKIYLPEDLQNIQF